MAKFVDPNERIIVVPYDPTWAEEFARERERIAGVLGGAFVELEHIGSTSVPGLSAKPIVDLQLAVESLDEPGRLIAAIESLGYANKPQDEPGHLFFRKGSPRTHHLHVYVSGTWDQRRHLLFRDYLREHSDVREQYEQLKLGLAEKFAEDRVAYTDAKTEFVESVVLIAAQEEETRK